MRELPPQVLPNVRDGLLRSLEYLHGLFALRGEPPPFPEPGIAFAALGPSLKRTLPQRLAAQLADELNGISGPRLEDVSQFTALGLHARITDLLRFVGFLEESRLAAERKAAPTTIVSARRSRQAEVKTASHARRSAGGPAPDAPSAKAAPPAPKPGAGAPESEGKSDAAVAQPVARAAAAAPGPTSRAAVPPAPAPLATVPGGPGPDLSSYDIRIDEVGERVDADGGTVWFAAGAGPRASGEGLAASFSVAFPGGIAFALADGAESSLGARLASAVAARAFCRAAALSPSAPVTAVRTAQSHLDMLLSALLAAADGSTTLTKVRGNVPAANARRILAHTRQPDEALRRVAPALATSLVGGVAVAARDGLRVSVVRLGPGSAEVRTAGRVSTLLGAPRSPAGFLGPGARGSEELDRVEAAPAYTLAPGDALLCGTTALAKGSRSAWTALAELWPSFPDGLATGETARDLLRRAERWGIAEPPHFGGPLAFTLLLAR